MAMRKATFCLIALLAVVAGCESPEYLARQHKAWCAVWRRPDVTYEDWKILKESDMLPGQSKPNSDNNGDLATGIAIGTALSSGSK